MEDNHATKSKYEAVLAKYNTTVNDEEIAKKVAEITEKEVSKNDTKEIKKLLFSCIDLTTLRSEDNDKSVMEFVEKVNKFDNDYADLENVASICVYPNFAEIVKDTLEVDNVGITCVAGSFPSSQTFIEVKIAEVAMAIMHSPKEFLPKIKLPHPLCFNLPCSTLKTIQLKAICLKKCRAMVQNIQTMPIIEA
jgi:Deoxyribose-phosphate aldolase